MLRVQRVPQLYVQRLLQIRRIMPKNKNSKSFEIALSGVASAIAVIFLSLGILSGWLVATGYFFGVIALMLPLSRNFYWGGLAAYIATCILTLIMGVAGNFWHLVPFIMFFGLHPLANALCERFKINVWIALAVKAIWFDCTLIAAYFIIYGGLLGGGMLPQSLYDVVNKYIYLFIFTLGTLILVVYDFLVQRAQKMVNALVRRIKR